MQVTLDELKRKRICPILDRHKWDYSDQNPQSEFFRFCIAEMMGWQYRKGRAISYDIMSSLISRLAAERNVDRLEVSDIQLALKSFTRSGIYSKIDELVMNMEIQVGTGNHVIKHKIPAISNIKDNTCIMTWDDRIRSAEDIKQSYEARLISVWSFYSLNRYPVFYNLYLDNDKVEQVRYKPNQFYIRDSKAFLKGVDQIINDIKIHPAPLEICRNCARRQECQTSKTRTKNWQKSW